MKMGVCKPKKTRWLVRAAVGAALLVSSQAGVAAEAGVAVVRGTVQTASGTPVPDARITAQNRETGLSRSTRSDARGQFEIGELPPGSYQIATASD